MRRTLFSAVAVAMAVFFWACSQPTTTTTVASSERAGSQALSAGQVATTIRGQILDGLGNPVPGVSVEYSDGSNPAVTTTPAARTLQSTGSDSHGIFELQYLSQTVDTTGALGGTVYVSLKRDGYTGRRIPITIPRVTALSAQTVSIPNAAGTTTAVSINVGQTIQVDLTNSGTTSTSAGTKTYVTNTVGGFHVASDLGTATMFQLAAEVTGTVKLKNADTDPNGAAALPATNSIIAFNFPDNTYSPYVITAMVDATGKFVFGASGRNAAGAANPLPIFGANSNSTNATSGTTTLWDTTSNTKMASMPYFSVQVATGQSDALGSAFYLINSASTSNGNLIPNLSFLTTSAATPQSLGTVYAIADNRARVIAWSPQTVVDNVVVPMAQLTGTTPTPITLTFSKAMNPLLTPVTGISLTSGGVNYWTADATIAWNATNTVATLTPKVTFPKGATLTLAIANWVAADGAAVASTGLPTFTVQDGMTILGASWLDASRVSTQVALNATPAVTFNLAPASFDPTLTLLWDTTTGAQAAATFALNATTKQLVATPAAPLKPGDVYEIRFSVSSGVVGDPAVSYNGTTIVPSNTGLTTALLRFKADTTNQLLLNATNLWAFDSGAPYITSQFDGTKAITLTFNKKIATTPVPAISLVKTAGSVPVLATVTWDVTGTIATVTPTLALAANTQYTVSYSVYPDATTLSGGMLSEGLNLSSSIVFTTGSPATIKLINTTTVVAGQGAQLSLPVTSPIVLTYDTPVVLTKAPTFTLSPSTAFTIAWNGTNTVATLTPVTTWLNGQAYTLAATVNADALGTNTLTSNLSFTTTPAVAVSNVQIASTTAFPVSGTPVVMTFNQPVKTGAGQFVITLYQAANTAFWYANNQVNIPTTVTWDATNTVATVSPTSALQLNKTYGIGYQVFAAVGNGSVDNGNVSAGVPYGSFLGAGANYTFTTVAASVPRLVSTNLQVSNVPAATFPYLGAAGANNITLTFDQAIPGSTAVVATSFVYGKTYAIATVGTTDYTLLGAANNTVGTVFTMSGGLGAGTGTAFPILGYSAVLSGGPVNPALVGSFDVTGTILTLSTAAAANLTPNSAYTLTYNVTNANLGVTGNKTLGFTTALPVYANIPTLSLDTTGGKLTYDHADSLYSVQVTGLDPLATQLVFEAVAGTNTVWNSIGAGAAAYVPVTNLTYIGGTGTTAKYLYSFNPSTPAGVALVSGSNVRLRVRQNFGTVAANDSPNSTVLSVTDTTAPVAANVGLIGSPYSGLNSASASSTFVTLKFTMTGAPANEALALPALGAISLYSGTWPGTPVSASLATVTNAYLSQTTNANDTLNVVLNLAKYVRLGTAPAAVTVNDGSFIIGNTYTIAAVGTTNFVAIGASANTVGVSFVATGAGGAGSGSATTTSFVATSLVAGSTYTIASTGTTNFTLIGAPTNTVGTTFVATGAGTGNGTATPTPVYGLNIGSLVSGTASAAGSAFADAAGNLLDNGVAASKTTKGQINFTIGSTGALTPVTTN